MKFQKPPQDNDIFYCLKNDFLKVRCAYEPILKSISDIFGKKIDLALLENGKKIRSAIVLLFAKASGARTPAMHFYGAIIELIHLASLVHDDIIDNGNTRRGVDCFHRRLGSQSAVLIGDYIYISAIKSVLDRSCSKFNRLLAKATLNMVHGEIAQSGTAGCLNMSEMEYLNFISRKTGALFAVAGHIGTSMGKYGNLVRSAETAAMAMGKAFQIRDDLLDLEHNSNFNTGKDFQNDACNQILTLPIIHYLRTCSTSERAHFTKFYPIKNNRMNLFRLLHHHGSIDYAQKKARRYIKEAKQRILGFPDNIHRKHLMVLCDYIIERNR